MRQYLPDVTKRRLVKDKNWFLWIRLVIEASTWLDSEGRR